MRRLFAVCSLFGMLIVWGCANLKAQCNFSLHSSGQEASYTQVYIATDAAQNILASNSTGNFNNLPAGAFYFYALNYNPAQPPAPLPADLIGQPIALVGSSTAGCYNADFLSDRIVRVCGDCQHVYTFCSSDPLIVHTTGANAAYTQLFVLADAVSNLIVATSATGDFSALSLPAGSSLRAYALNYDPAQPPAPLPNAGTNLAQFATIATGCSNGDFLTDFACINITECATQCFRSQNVLIGNDIQTRSSGANSAYEQVYILADDTGPESLLSSAFYLSKRRRCTSIL